MEASSGDRSNKICRHIVTGCAMGLFIFGASAEVGWVLGVPWLKSILPGSIAMNPTSAALFLLCSITFLALSFDKPGRHKLVLATSVAMTVVGVAKDAGYLFGRSLPVDRLLFWSKLDPKGPFHGNALAPNAALCFVLLGLTLPRFAAKAGKLNLANPATFLAIAIAVSALVGYVFSALPFYELGTYAPMALPTSICFLMVGAGCIALRPNDGIAKLFTEEAVGSVLVRRVLPVATLTPLLFGIIRSVMDRYGILNPTIGKTLAIVATMAVIAGLILSAAKALNATDRKRQDVERQLADLAAQLREQAEKSQEASRSKSLFLATMSHEIRTPLNGVLGTASLLENRALQPDDLRMVGIIRSSGETLLRVIDDILDFSKIEAGKLDVENAPVNLIDLVRDIVALYQAQAERRGIFLSAVVPEDDIGLVMADPVRVKQILGNLISNAIKFTSMGGVYVTLELQSIQENHARMAMTVRDTGIGIPEDRQSAVFDSFTQADGSTHRRFGGTGLGLAICKRLVELMHGQITLQSASERGSTFTVLLDLELAPIMPKEASRAIGREVQPNLRVLVAEDNEVNAMVASSLLEDLGCIVTLVGDGVSAIAAVAADRFDVVLMDIHMPLCDGLEATRAIRQTAKGAALRIIALTASALLEDRQECLAAGMNGFLSKPFTRTALADALTADCIR